MTNMISIGEIVALTALNFGTTPHELVSDRRSRQIVLPRHVAMYLAKKATGTSLPDIGKHFGGRDHTSVHYAIDRVEAEMKADPRLKALVATLEDNIALRERMAATGGVDVINAARRIAANPRRQAMSASVMEVAALAATTLDLWEVALCAEELAATLGRGDIEAAERERVVGALATAITEELAAIRGEKDGEEDDA